MAENEDYEDKKVPKTTRITPTNFISNPCKFKGKTIEILSVLYNSSGMTAREISDHTGITVREVWVYCRRGEKKGIFERK